jgi:YesN/AraC family two-component response regulator
LGINYEITNKTEKAMDAYLKSLRLAFKLKDSLSIHMLYINLGYISIDLNDFEVSGNYLNRALQYFTKKEDSLNILLCYQNLAYLETKRGNIKNAESNYDDAGNIAINLKDEATIVGVLNDKANFLIDNKYPKSTILKIVDQLDSIAKQTETPYLLALINFVRARYLIYYTDQLTLADDYLNKAEGWFLTNDVNGILIGVCVSKIELAARQQDFTQHKILLDQLHDYLESGFKKTIAQDIAELNTMHQLNLKNEMLNHYENTILIKNNQLNQSLILGSIILIGFCLSVFLYYKIKAKNKFLFKKNMELMRLVGENNDHLQFIIKEDIEQSNEILDEYNNVLLEKLFMKIKRKMIKNKLFLNPNLKVVDLADLMATNEKYISIAINNFGNKRFNHFVNFYRVNEAKKILTTEVFQGISMNDVAIRSGFSNQPNFQKVFKKYTSLTPLNFMKLNFTTTKTV